MHTTDDVRVGDAERDTVMVALHDHFAEGRLDRDELDERLGTVLAAKTRGELRRVVRDLPGPSGLPEPGTLPGPRGLPGAAPDVPGLTGAPWGAGAALLFGGGHPAMWHHHRHMHRMNRHMNRHMRGGRRHGPPLPALPLLLAVFLVAAFTIGPGAGLLAVLQVALVIWVVRAVLVALGVRRSRHRHQAGA